MKLHSDVSGSGHDLVLLHGAGLELRMWDRTLPFLTERARVIRYDLRGHGASPSPTEPFSDVEDLAQVLDDLELESAVLAGHSLGGAIAIDFTLAYPQRVSGLVLIGTNLSGHTWPPTSDLTASARARRSKDLDAFVELELRMWAPLGTSAEIDRLIRDGARRRFAEDELPDLVTPTQDATDRLPELDAPTLLLTPRHDQPEILRIAQRITAAVPGARQQLLAADHMLPVRLPADVARLTADHADLCART